MQPRDIIRLLAETEVLPGTTGRFVCPVCRGGTSSEPSLAITRNEDGSAVFKCHRASCGASGAAIPGRGVSTPIPRPLRPYTGPLRGLEEYQYRTLWDKYHLGKAALVGIRYSETLDRYMLPVRNYWGGMRGWVARSFEKEPKVLTFKEDDSPFIGHLPQTGGATVIVEDYFSACKVASAGYYAVYLNGSYLSPEGAAELRTHQNVIVALDSDAFAKGIKMKQQYDFASVWKLSRDLKYVDEQEIRDAVVNGKANFVGLREGPGGLRGDIF